MPKLLFNDRAQSGKDYSFLDHLEILRGRILGSLSIFITATILCFVWSEELIAFLLTSVERLEIDLITIRPQEKFLSYIKVSALGGIVASLPFAMVLLGHFVLEGLTKRERRNVIPFVIASLVFFYAGLVFANLIIGPFAIRFFYHFAQGDGVINQWSLGEYIGILLSIHLALAISFQAPWIIIALVKLDILSVETVRKYRRHTVVLVFLIAAFLTPPDIWTQLLVGISLLFLYEGTLLVAISIDKRRKKKKASGLWTDENS